MDINYALLMPPPPRPVPKHLLVGVLGSVGLIALSAIVVAGVLLSSYSHSDARPAMLGASVMSAAVSPAPQPPAPAAAMPAPAAPEPTAAPSEPAPAQVKKATPAKKRIGRHGKSRTTKAAPAKAGPAKRVKGPDAALRKLLGI
ncbi:MAG: hypothetical protein HY906_24140 [Deltaproteobacteria bacterium]|nr:hypothetical protein [Deltaproteobacteria bacterium]